VDLCTQPDDAHRAQGSTHARFSAVSLQGMLFSLFFALATAQSILWRMSYYSATVLGCGSPTPLYFDAFPDPACTPSPCFCSGDGNRCASIICGNFTSPATPPPPAGFVGYAGYSDSSCSTPTQFRAAPVGCSTYGGGAVSISCSSTQLSFIWSPTIPTCRGNAGNELFCNVQTSTCGVSSNGACGSYTKNTCGSTTSSGQATTTPATTTRPANASVQEPCMLVALFAIALAAAIY
jgi:hypothetical protein